MAESSAEPMISVECDLGAEDWLALLRQHRRREGRWHFLGMYAVILLPPLVFFAAYFAQVRPAGVTLGEWVRLAPDLAAGAVILPVALYAFLAWRTRRNAEQMARREGKVAYEFTPTGWTRSTDERTSSVSWSGVRRVVETDAHFFVVWNTTTGAAAIADTIPKRALPNGDSVKALRDLFAQTVGEVVDDRHQSRRSGDAGRDNEG